MMTKTKKVLATLATAAAITAGASVVQVPTAEVEKDAFQFENVNSANSFRRYLSERENYMKELSKKGEVPQTSLDKATFAKDEYEGALLKRKMIDSKGGEIKEKPPKKESLLKKVSFGVKQAYAFTFGKEDMEACISIPCNFTSNDSYATGAIALDTSSKVNATNSIRCDIAAADDGCVLTKSLTSAAQYYIQYYLLVPTGWTFGANGYLALFATKDGTGNPVYCNLEDYGTVRITCAGDELGYTDTAINVTLNAKTRLEFRVKISATVGDLDIWKDSTVEGTTSYNGSGTLNTGSQNITGFHLGGYHPDIVNDVFYDDTVVDTAFIGVGTSVRRRIINTE